MNITSATAWRVRVPLMEEWASSPDFGSHPAADRLILRLTSDEGLEGWGEGPWNMSTEAVDAMLLRIIESPSESLRSSFLDGLSLKDEIYWCQPLPPSGFTPPTENLRHRLRHPVQVAVETALLDLRARRLGEPLHVMLGGLWREWVPTDYWMGRVTPEHAAKCARRGRELGFNGIKLKTTLEDPNVERLEAIRDEAGADFHVTVDPNGRFYRLDDAWPTIKAMDAVGNMRILEDPFPRSALIETKELRARIDARAVIHIDPPEMLAEVLRSGSCGGLNIDSHTQGLFGWRMQAAAADQFNLPVWHGSGLDCGISTAAQLHLAGSTPNCQLPGDQIGPWLRESSLVHESFAVEDGKVRVPTGPGLGVEADLDAIAKYTVWKSHAGGSNKTH